MPEATIPAPAAPASRQVQFLRLAFYAACVLLLGGVLQMTRAPLPQRHDLAQGLHGFSSNYVNPDQIPDKQPIFAPVKVGDVNTVEIRGPGQLYSLTRYPVDGAKTYQVSARLRSVHDDPTVGGVRTYIGVVTYDSAGKPLSDEQGTHRYNVLLNRIVKEQDGWIRVRGKLSGFGATQQNFRPGTVTVSLAALMNYETPGGISQIAELRFEEDRSQGNDLFATLVFVGFPLGLLLWIVVNTSLMRRTVR